MALALAFATMQFNPLRRRRPQAGRRRILALGAASFLEPALAVAAPLAPADGPPPAGLARAKSGWLHAYAAFGDPKYPRGFDHFEYMNPAAPKGGTLYLANPDRRTAFDKFNPFTVRGASPAGLEIFMLET